MVPAEQLRGEIDERLGRGQNLLDSCHGSQDDLREQRQEYLTWTEYNDALLRRSFAPDTPADEYSRRPPVAVVGGQPDPLPVRWDKLRADIEQKQRRLRSIQERLTLYRVHPEATHPASLPTDPDVLGTDVFIVHGHDGETKVTVARFLSKLLAREPVILHEQADRGRTIIEKFESHAAKAACAVVLLTGDDEGGALREPARKPRARQNVVLELGFFLGKLGRDRVVILYEPGVELPSDLAGVIYIELDKPGAWRNATAREIKAAGLDIDLGALL